MKYRQIKFNNGEQSLVNLEKCGYIYIDTNKSLIEFFGEFTGENIESTDFSMNYKFLFGTTADKDHLEALIYYLNQHRDFELIESNTEDGRKLIFAVNFDKFIYCVKSETGWRCYYTNDKFIDLNFDFIDIFSVVLKAVREFDKETQYITNLKNQETV
jgi:hypothetical protein